jgi:hypothetical protein
VPVRLKGLAVYDPKLAGNPVADIVYRLNAAAPVCAQLRILQGATTVATLLAKTATPTRNADATVHWDGRWDNGTIEFRKSNVKETPIHVA